MIATLPKGAKPSKAHVFSAPYEVLKSVDRALERAVLRRLRVALQGAEPVRRAAPVRAAA
jgi:hypothetical protein